ncbi:MAG: SH3 domain-containing protein, partial [Anaerolineae bacterium]|nr:SH3 domain-containing protein [Anaerolineae bacterium]
EPPPVVATATLPEPFVQALYTPTVIAVGAATSTLPPTAPLPTATLPPTSTMTPPPTVTAAPPPTATGLAPSTRVAALPESGNPLDDGSGNPLTGTGGNESQGESLAAPAAAALARLPATLYYLSDADGVAQVWRARYGLGYPEQLTFDTPGIAAFGVAPDGTLAIITPGGQLVIGGIPFLPPTVQNTAGEDVLPQVTALAWSPAGDWLAYTLATPGAADFPQEGDHRVDGLWMRNRDGETFRLAANRYTGDARRRAITGPLSWRPDGTEILAGIELADGFVYYRVDITTSRLIAVWNDFTLPPSAFLQAHWTRDGSAIIASGGQQIARVNPDDLSVIEALVDLDAGLEMAEAWLFPDGTLVFVGSPINPSPSGPPTGPRRLYRIPPGQRAPLAVTESLTDQGLVGTLWDEAGQRALLVIYDPAESPLGAAYWRDSDGSLLNLTPLSGWVGSPVWGPLFQVGDRARIHTTEGDTLNLRVTPGGDVVTRLVDGQRVTIMGGPLVVDGFRWWRVQTPDQIDGWVVESVINIQGQRLVTLLPVE